VQRKKKRKAQAGGEKKSTFYTGERGKEAPEGQKGDAQHSPTQLIPCELATLRKKEEEEGRLRTQKKSQSFQLGRKRSKEKKAELTLRILSYINLEKEGKAQRGHQQKKVRLY